jgi:nitrite reductase (NADH) large subunit
MEDELESDEVIEVIEQRKSSYRKLVVREGKLVSAMLVGNTAAAATLVQHFDRGDVLPADPVEALCPGMVTAPLSASERVVCNCNKVSEAAIQQCIAGGCDTVEAVGAACRAGTGCGSCKTDVARLVALHAPPRPPLAAVG